MPAHAPASPMRDGTPIGVPLGVVSHVQQKRRFNEHTGAYGFDQHQQTNEACDSKRFRVFQAPTNNGYLHTTPTREHEEDSQRKFGRFYNTMQVHTTGHTMELAAQTSSSPIDLGGVSPSNGMHQIDQQYRETYVNFFNNNNGNGHQQEVDQQQQQHDKQSTCDMDDVDMMDDEPSMGIDQLFDQASAVAAPPRTPPRPNSNNSDSCRHLGNYSPSLVSPFCRPLPVDSSDRCCLYPYPNDYY